MKTKPSLLTAGAIALLAVLPAARAVENTNPPPAQERQERGQAMREQRMKELDEKLNLTAEQKSKIAAIWDKAAEEGRAEREDGKLKRREQRKERRELMKDTRAQIRSVLTPEQQKIFDEMPRPKRGKPGGA
jgi:Spy/CpxP family protein refolding chaperone